jgi:rhodanese-related sulfurtransferase
MNIPVKLMYVIGALAGAAVGVLILWLLFPRTAEAGAAPSPVVQVQAAAEPEHVHAEEFERISIAELKDALARKAVTVIDVRSMDQYVASHIPGSLHIPVSLIEGEVAYLPKDKPIVTYCSCPAEESSGQAAMILAHAGVGGSKALKGGFDEWVKLGLPVKSGRER